jgi:hypothetical protein
MAAALQWCRLLLLCPYVVPVQLQIIPLAPSELDMAKYKDRIAVK